MKKEKNVFAQIKKKKARVPSASKLIKTYEKQLYDHKQMLEIAKSLCSVLDFSTLIESILYICMCQMRVYGAAMYIHKTFDSDFFVLEDNYNALRFESGTTYAIPAVHPLISYLNKTNETYTLDELLRMFEYSEAMEQLVSLKPSLIIPLKQKNHLNGILLLGERIDVGEDIAYDEYERRQISTIASLAAIAINNAALVEMTTTDLMTHLKLKHYFYTVLADKLEFSVSQKLPLCLVMLDIDFFKNVNDTYGHACGDFILQQIAKIIFQGIRGQDMAARYGGEEFIVMLFDTDEEAAFKVAERIRHAIEEYRFTYENICIRLTVSIGISMFVPGTSEVSVRELIDHADQALYESKRRGRNRVSLFTPVSEKIMRENGFFSCEKGFWSKT